jgi:hypothetical protein
MGNLVTHALTLSGPEPDLTRLIGLLTETDPDRLLAAARSHPDRIAWADFAPWRLVPEPDVISETGDGGHGRGEASIGRALAPASIR